MENNMAILCLFVAVFTLQAAKCLCFIPETEEVSASTQQASDAMGADGSSTLWSAHKEPGSAGYRLQKFPFAMKTEGGAVIGLGGVDKRGFWDKRNANRRVYLQLQEVPLPQGVFYYPH